MMMLTAIRPDRTRGGRSSYEGSLQHSTMFERPLTGFTPTSTSQTQAQRRTNGSSPRTTCTTTARYVFIVY